VKSWLRSRPAIMLAGALCAGMAATWAVGKVLDKRDEDRRDQFEVARMTDKMKTVCVGRFLIDVPEEAQVDLRQARVDGFNISVFNESEEEFQQRLSEREAQLAAKPDYLGGNKNLEVAREVKTESGLVGKILMHSRTVVEGTQGNGLGVERYRDEGITVEALVHGRGLGIDLYFENRGLEWLEDLPRLVNQLVPNPEGRSPDEPGFCVDRAYFRDPVTADQREQIMMFVQLPTHPDINFSLMLSAGGKPVENGILVRTDAADAKLSMTERMRISRLRAASREIGNLEGEELAEMIVEENDARVHSFWWEVKGTEDNVFVPRLVFKMNTGSGNRAPVPSSLSDGAALGLWDKILSSIRQRTTISATASQTDVLVTPLGTQASAGERCPESGWWLCGDGGNNIGVLGGQRQYIKKGDRMPQALLLPPRSLWDKVRGVQPSFESTNLTFWKLMDKRLQKRVPPSMALAPSISLSPRSSVNNEVSVEEQKHAAVGSFAVTGAACPASGWWRCEEPYALDGTRWFAKGSLLPPATFTVPPGVFGRSTNTPKSIQRRGEWRLVRLIAAPAGNEPRASTGEDDSLLPPTEHSHVGLATTIRGAI